MNTEQNNNLSQRKAAIIAGFSIILMAVFAGFSYGYVMGDLIVAGDAAKTAANIKASEGLFRVGVFGWLLILVCDVLAAWALYIFMQPTNKNISLLAAWFRLIYSAILGVAIAGLLLVVLLSNAGNVTYLKAFSADQLQGLVSLFIGGFNDVWVAGLFIFGGHLLVLGYLVLKSGYVPKVLGILLIVAAVCYLATSAASMLLTNYAQYKATIDTIAGVPMAIGELAFALWLLIRGGKTQ